MSKLLVAISDSTGFFKFIEITCSKEYSKIIFEESNKYNKSNKSANNFISLFYGKDNNGSFILEQKKEIKTNNNGLYAIQKMI